jgi:rod shape-determining protein MreC
LISIDHRHANLSALRSALSVAVYPVQYLVTMPVRLVDAAAGNLRARDALQVENEHLRTENLLLRARTQRYAALEQENRRLRELLDSSPVLGEEVVVADVIAVDSNPSSRQILINKGSRQHIYVGQPIADAQGVLGQVIQVSPYTSTALLISDARHALPVQVNRTGVRAIAVGAGESDRLLLSFVPTNADIAPGDPVVSSGLDNRFPAGYPVGKVAEVTVVPGEPFSRIVVEPSAQLGRSREVLLVWPQARTRDEAAPAARDAPGGAAPVVAP